MPTIIEITVYEFDELPNERAKEHARDWYRSLIDADDFACVIDDFITIATILGVSTSFKQVYWSGFASQGDGASFEGSYAYAKGSTKAIREYAPKDTTLHDIADRFMKVQKRNRWEITATITKVGRYCHDGCMEIDVHNIDPDGWDDIEVQDLLRELAQWLYHQLDRENDYLHSAESVDENIRANGYTFTAEGKRFG